MPSARTRRAGQGLALVLAVLTLAVAVPLVQGSRAPLASSPPAVEARPVICTVDVNYPLEVQVVPLGPVTPGSRVQARIDVSATTPIDDIQVAIKGDPGVRIQQGTFALGTAAVDRAPSMGFSVDVPTDATAKSVTITVQGHSDGFPVQRTLVWNLALHGGEVRETVVTADGRSIHQVQGRTIR